MRVPFEYMCNYIYNIYIFTVIDVFQELYILSIPIAINCILYHRMCFFQRAMYRATSKFRSMIPRSI